MHKDCMDELGFVRRLQKGMGKKMKRFLLVSGGKTEDDFAKEYISKERFDVFMAADSGMEFYYRNDLKPDVIVGDFDSVTGEALSFFKKQEGILFRELNPMKDDTDTESALRLAIEMGAEEIVLLGATGSRLDHVLGNIELLGIGLQKKVRITIVDKNNRIRMLDTGIWIRKEEQFGKYVSLIPYTEAVEGLTLIGMKYPLEDFTLRGFCSLGISNEIEDEEAEIRFRKGILIMIESRDWVE